MNPVNPQNAFRSSVLLAAACLLLAGCRISTSRHGNGDNVQIGTPFGSVHVKTDNDANIAGIGLTTHHGAVPVTEHDGKNKDAADINLNFGDFHLGVKAASFQTSDAPDKVEAFYRRDMARYGDILECKGKDTVGQPTRTAAGLTCSENQDHHRHTIHVNTDADHLELRAGSPEHEHIVGIEPKDGGTKIGLVALDLPSHHDASDRE